MSNITIHRKSVSEATWQKVEVADTDVVYYDGQVMRWASVPLAAKADATNATPYQSEIAVALLNNFGTDDQGRLINAATGEVITQPENTDPLPQRVKHGGTDDGVAALQQWKQDHPYFTAGIDVDGNSGLVKFPGDTSPHARYTSSQEPGFLVLEQGTEVPTPTPVIQMPTPTDGAVLNLTIPPPKGNQIRPAMRGKWKITLPDQPAPGAPGHTGFMRTAEIPGSQRATGNVTVTWPDGQVFTTDLNGFVVQYAVGDPVPNVPYTVPVGSTIIVEGEGDVLFDYRTASW